MEGVREGVPHRVRLARASRHLGPWVRFPRLPSMRHLLMALVALGVLLRLATFNTWGLVYDGAEYAVMGQSLLQHGEFLVPYAPGVVYYHHYGPLFPAYLAAFYEVLGFGVAQTKLAELVLSVLLIAVVYLTTRDLLGSGKAWFAATFVALEPMFLITSVIGYEEDLVGLLFVATMWAILKSLKEPRYLLLAGVLAGMGFLAKAPIGYVFVLAGVGGILWRVLYHGWGALRDRWYLSGMAAFALLAGMWSLRNVARFGWPNWGTSAELDAAYAFGLGHPGILMAGLVEKLPWFALMFLFYGGVFLPELRRSLARVREEETSALWLAVGLVFLMGWIVSAFFWTVEGTPIWWHDNLRYVVIASPILLWAALREVSPARRSGSASPRLRRWPFPKRFLALMTVFAAIGLVIVAFPAPYSQITAIQDASHYLRPGDVLAVDGFSPEQILPYVASTGAQVVTYAPGFNGTFVLSSRSSAYHGFVLVAAFHGQDLTGWSYACDLWAKANVAADRAPNP